MLGFPCVSDGKECACNAGGFRFNSWVRTIPWRRKWQPTPEILAWRIPWTEPGGLHTAHGVAKSQTQLSS